MKYLLFTLTLVFFVGAEQSSNEMNENDLQASLASLQNTIPGLPNLMEGLPSIDEGEEVVKEKCLRNGNNESYEHAMAAKGKFQDCVRNLVNFEKIEEEMEKAKPTGDLDMVFKKYCRKTPYLRECLANFTIAVTPCLEPSEVEGKNIALNLTDSMMRFICHKEGDRIALFIAEGGPECLKAKVQYVQTCWNETFSNVEINATNPAAAMPHFVLDEDRCRKMTYVKECVVKHLEECREPTPANVIGSMFDFVKKQSPCHQYETGGSSSISSTVLCLIFPIVAYFLAKF